MDERELAVKLKIELGIKYCDARKAIILGSYFDCDPKDLLMSRGLAIGHICPEGDLCTICWKVDGMEPTVVRGAKIIRSEGEE